MHKSRFHVSVVLVASLVAACVEPDPLLNSERIEAAYGSYGIEVLEANGHERVTNLYSTESGRRTTRTWAEVRFMAPLDDAVREEHAIVIAGGSIGEVFRAHGWTVSKRNLRIGRETLDGSRQDVADLMRLATPVELAVHEYAFVVGRDGREIEYAVITERHHPGYLTVADLRRIYGEVGKTAK